MDALRLIAEPRRREILQRIWFGERCAGDIAAGTNVSFSAVSQHLARLRAAGIVAVRRDGRRRWYRVRREALGPVAEMLEQFWGDRFAHLKQLAEDEEARRD